MNNESRVDILLEANHPPRAVGGSTILSSSNISIGDLERSALRRFTATAPLKLNDERRLRREVRPLVGTPDGISVRFRRAAFSAPWTP